MIKLMFGAREISTAVEFLLCMADPGSIPGDPYSPISTTSNDFWAQSKAYLLNISGCDPQIKAKQANKQKDFPKQQISQ